MGATARRTSTGPLDPHIPSDRVGIILALAGAGNSSTSTASRQVPTPRWTTTRDIALITFTSGSNGEPKGVVIDHATRSGKARDCLSGQGIRWNDRIADIMPLGFQRRYDDVAVRDRGRPCRRPARGFPRDGVEPLLDWLATSRATTVSTSVSLCRRLAAAAAVRDGLRPPSSTVRQITFYAGALQRLGHRPRPAPVHPRTGGGVNWYGATEVGVVGFTRFEPFEDVPPGRVIAGRPPPGRTVTIVDADGRALPVGQVGRGGRARRHHRERATSSGTTERFLPDTGSGAAIAWVTAGSSTIRPSATWRACRRCGEDPGGTSSSRPRWRLPSGRHRRRRGVRGADTTSTASSIWWPGVGSASVAPSRIEADVRTAVATAMPSWMVAALRHRHDSLPRTERGKVDRAALPAPHVEMRRRRTGRPMWSSPRSGSRSSAPSERRPRRGPGSRRGRFVDSLALARIAVTLRQAVAHVEPDLVAFTAAPTIATLSDGLRGPTPTHGRGPATVFHVPLRTDGNFAPLFLVIGCAGAPASAFIPWLRALSPHRPVHGLQARGLETPGRPDRSVRALARRNVETVTAIHPTDRTQWSATLSADWWPWRWPRS